MRSLIVSDLHLGGRTRVDVLREDGPARERLAAAVADADRLVLLGDTLELRHGPAADALAAARPALEMLGAALAPDAEVLLVPGNHDYALAAPWLEALRTPLGLERRVKAATASPLARTVASWLGTKRTAVAYPGVWLRDDVYATHGHHLDVHATLPTFERLAAGAMRRLSGGLPDGPLRAEDYERILAPLYAWAHATAQRARPGALGAAGGAARAYEMLEGDGHKPFRAKALAAVFPLGIRGLNLAGIGPLSADLSGPALRRSALLGISEALTRLGVEAEHVVFGHSHRAGMMPADEPGEWRTPGGAALHNSGNWVFESHFMAGPDGTSPYWPGTMVEVGDAGPPLLHRLLDDVPGEALSPPGPA